MSESFFLRRVLKWHATYPLDINITKLLIGVCAFSELCIMVLSFALGVKAQVELVLIHGLSCFAVMVIGSWLYYEPSYNHYKMLLVVIPLTIISAVVCFIFSRTWRNAALQLCDDVYNYSPAEYYDLCDTLLSSRNSFYYLLIVSVVLRILSEIACLVGSRRHHLLTLEAQRLQRERREKKERDKAMRTERERRQKQLDRRELKKKVRREQSQAKSEAPLL